MATHNASITVRAPVSQVYQLWTHFNDFPKFMTFIKEVTYKNDQISHWVADIVGRHEWDAVNENWIENQQIGWRSIDGLNNSGLVTFHDLGDNTTRLKVTVDYDPPAGVIGDLGEAMGGGNRFEHALAHDLNHFAEMVRQAPPDALDPTSSTYLFHKDSATGRAETTDAQDATNTSADFVHDDPHFLASETPQNINQAFPTDLRDDLSPSDTVTDRGAREEESVNPS